MSEITTKKKLMDTLGWGFILWLIGFALGMMLFPFVPVELIGWPILIASIPIIIFVAYKRFNNLDASSSQLFGCCFPLSWITLLS